MISVRVPGKIHLMGEHAVVYGKPALLTTINKYCTVQLIPNQTKRITITAINFDQTKTFPIKKVQQITDIARKKWLLYSKNKDMTLLKLLTKNPLDYSIIAIGETAAYFHKDFSSGFTLTIDSDIPIGAGLGSSAALAVAIVAATTVYLNKLFYKAVLNTIAFQAEQRKHGFPSGGDTSAVCFGGLTWFRKESSDFQIIQPVNFTVPKIIADKFILIDTGRPVESTGEMVGFVQNFSQEKPALVNAFLQDQEALTRDLLTALKNSQEDKIMQIVQKGERNLEKIGVVSNFSKSIIRAIEKAGGAAKISGAGGRKKGSGFLLAYHQQTNILESIAKKRNLSCYLVEMGAKGVQVSE